MNCFQVWLSISNCAATQWQLAADQGNADTFVFESDGMTNALLAGAYTLHFSAQPEPVFTDYLHSSTVRLNRVSHKKRLR
jgi:hypothetical protein